MCKLKTFLVLIMSCGHGLCHARSTISWSQASFVSNLHWVVDNNCSVAWLLKHKQQKVLTFGWRTRVRTVARSMVSWKVQFLFSGLGARWVISAVSSCKLLAENNKHDFPHFDDDRWKKRCFANAKCIYAHMMGALCRQPRISMAFLLNDGNRWSATRKMLGICALVFFYFQS